MGWWYLQTAGFCCVYSIKLQTVSFDGCDNNYIEFRMAPQGMQLRRTCASRNAVLGCSP